MVFTSVAPVAFFRQEKRCLGIWCDCLGDVCDEKALSLQLGRPSVNKRRGEHFPRHGYNHGLKSWHTFAFQMQRVWGIFQFTHAQPPPLTPQLTHWTRGSRIYSEFQLCIRWGELQGCSSFLGNPEITEKYEYFFTVPRTFVHDCIYYKQLKPY